MLPRTMLIGVMAAAGTVCVAAALAQESETKRSKNAALSGWEIVQSAEFTLEGNSSAELTAECPDGKVPLGGGFSKHPTVPDSEPGFEVSSSFPGFFTFEGNLFSGWIVHVVNRGSASVFVTVWATCAEETTKTPQ